MTTTLTAAQREPRTFDEWKLMAIAVGRIYGVGSAEWNRLGEAAAKELSFRVWALKYEAAREVRAS